jgi:hypothetical protein
MTKLLITEITRMGLAFCVIGLQREEGKIRSVRPVTASANSWMHFPYQRGDVLQCDLAPFSGAKPHVEDRVSTHGFQKQSTVPESEVVAYLRKAEFAGTLPELFGCVLHENKSGSGLFAMPREATRSVCGTQTINLRLELAPMKCVPRWLFLREKSCAIFRSSIEIGAISSKLRWQRNEVRIAWPVSSGF